MTETGRNGSWRGPRDSFRNWLGGTLFYLRGVLDGRSFPLYVPWSQQSVSNYSLFCRGLQFSVVLHGLLQSKWHNRRVAQTVSRRLFESGACKRPTPRYWCGPRQRLTLVWDHESSEVDQFIANLILSASAGLAQGRRLRAASLTCLARRMDLEARFTRIHTEIDNEVYLLTYWRDLRTRRTEF